MGSGGAFPWSGNPLQIAEPDDEFGNGGGARVQFKPKELMGANRLLVEPGEAFLPPISSRASRTSPSSFFEMFKRKVEEVPRAASGIEYLGIAKFGMKRADDIHGIFVPFCRRSSIAKTFERQRLVMDALSGACTCAHSWRSGSMTVAATSRFT